MNHQSNFTFLKIMLKGDPNVMIIQSVGLMTPNWCGASNFRLNTFERDDKRK